MKAPKFKYVRVGTLEQAFELLDRYGEDARILAGGQSLMPTLNMRLSQPEILIDINRIESLKGIAREGDRVRIGALTRHVEVMESPVIGECVPLIAEAMPHVAHVAVRNRGTFGGSVALADPAAEMPACCLALGATLVVESSAGRREIAADDYFLGLYETARRPNEILTEALIPVRKPGAVSVFMELTQRHGDFAIAGLACQARVERDTVAEVRLVYFGSEDRPTMAKGTIAAIAGKRWTDETHDAAVAALATDLNPMTNLQGSGAMKLHLQRVLTKRAMDAVIERAQSASGAA